MPPSSPAKERNIRRESKIKVRSPWKRRLKLTLVSLVLVGLVSGIAGLVVWFVALNDARDLMPTIEAKLSDLKIPPSEILSSDGKVLYQDSALFREPVTLDQVPKVVQEAIIAAEDRRFYEHSGIDVWSMGRAAFAVARDRKYSQGGSTLTMQLAKMLSSNSQKTIWRKLQDMALAYEMENEWSKDRILQLYLNEAYFGEGAYGIKAAADVYFGRPLDRLSLSDAALLARCVRRPSDENPFRNFDKALSNRNVVLGEMRDYGMISQNEYEAAIKAKVHLNSIRSGHSARILMAGYFVEHVLQELHDKAPDLKLEDGGYKIYTTLDSRLQGKAEQALSHVLEQFRSNRVNTGAFVLLGSDGRVLAEVGGPDFSKNQYNIVTQGHRQPGSSFKSIVYATAIAEQKITEDSMVSNERLTITDPQTHISWSPHNDNGQYGGQVSVKTALAQSINVAAVHVLLDTGIDNVIAYAQNVFGITSKLPRFPSLALGTASVSPLEMAQAYSVFMLHGSRATPYVLDHIVDNSGSTVQSFQAHIVNGVLPESVCSQMDDLLRGVVTSGTGYFASSIPDARGKTGTTSDNKDAWFCGYAGNMVGVGWVGNQSYDPKRKAYVIRKMASSVFGGTVTVRMWTEIMKYAEQLNINPQLPKEAVAPVHIDKPVPPAAAQPSDAKAPDAAAAQTGVDKLPGSPGDSPSPTDIEDPSSTSPTSPIPGQGPVTLPPSSKKTAPPGVKGATTPKAQYVTVAICADSGELATQYCPEVVYRKFLKGEEPKKYCHLHGGD